MSLQYDPATGTFKEMGAGGMSYDGFGQSSAIDEAMLKNLGMQDQALQSQIDNAGIGVLDGIGAGVSAFSTGMGLYDQMWGKGSELRDEELKGRKLNNQIALEEKQHRTGFRNDVKSAFA